MEQNTQNNNTVQTPNGQQLYYLVPQGQAGAQPSAAQSEENIDYMMYVQKLLAKWKWIFKMGCIAVAVGLVIALSLPKHYSSTSVLAPEIAHKSSGGGLRSLAAMAGVNLSAEGAGTDAMLPDMYPQIIGSAPFIVELFSVPVQIVRGDETINTDLYTYLKEYGKSPWWSKVLSAPGKGISWIIKQFSDQEDEGYANIEATRLTPEQDKIFQTLGKLIKADVDKKTFLITINVTMADADIAKQVCDEVVNRLTHTVVSYRTEKARKDLEYYKKLETEAKDSYYQCQQKYAAYVDANQGFSRQSTLLEQQRLQNEASLAFSLYNQTAQQRQMAEAKVQQETPVCCVLQPATVPIKGDPSRAKILLVIVFIGGMAACAWVLWGELCKSVIKDIFSKKEA